VQNSDLQAILDPVRTSESFSNLTLEEEVKVNEPIKRTHWRRVSLDERF